MNNITSQAEKNVGANYPQWLLDGFIEVLVETGLNDIELHGHPYTWKRGRGTTTWLEIRLDRAMATNQWFECFPVAKLYNLEGSPSDYSVIFLDPNCRTTRQSNKSFWFENAWVIEQLCGQIIQDNWEADNNANIHLKIKNCADNLSVWGREITGCLAKESKSAN